MMRLVWIIPLLTSACAALPDDGTLQCAPDPAHACPQGFECAGDGRCYRTGHLPDLVDMGSQSDMVVVQSCATSADCPAGAPICGAQQACTSCGAVGSSSDCATNHPTTPLCGPDGACVECVDNEKCDASHETCNLSTHSCGPCHQNSDCASGICTVATGACADKANQFYVNNAPTAGCSDGHPGSFTLPFCTVQHGLNQSAMNGGKPVVVFAGTYPERLTATPTLIGNNDYVAAAVGIGKPLIKPMGPGIGVEVENSGTLKGFLSLDGFVFDGTGISDGSQVIECVGSTSTVSYSVLALTLTDSTVENGPALGLQAENHCTLAADAVIVRSNKGGAILLGQTDFTLTNLLVTGNGTSTSDFGGVIISSLGEAGKMVIANLTVVGNSEVSTGTFPAGLYCANTLATFINTVIVGNVGGPSETNAATCSPTPLAGNAFVGAPGSNEDISTCT